MTTTTTRTTADKTRLRATADSLRFDGRGCPLGYARQLTWYMRLNEHAKEKRRKRILRRVRAPLDRIPCRTGFDFREFLFLLEPDARCVAKLALSAAWAGVTPSKVGRKVSGLLRRGGWHPDRIRRAFFQVREVLS